MARYVHSHNFKRLQIKRMRQQSERFRPVDFLLHPHRWGKRNLFRQVDPARLQFLRTQFEMDCRAVANAYVPTRIAALLNDVAGDLPASTRLTLRDNIVTTIARLRQLRAAAEAQFDAFVAGE